MKTILVVDDEIGIVNVVLAALEDEGYCVVGATDGERGLEQLSTLRPDLVISDLMMPFMNGATMAQEMRADPAYQQMPIIIMSAMPEVVVQKQLDTYQGFLRKPFRVAAMLELISTVLNERAQ